MKRSYLKLFCPFLAMTLAGSMIFGKSNSGNMKVKADEGSSNKIVYMTFDDGPSNIVTNKVLDILKEKDIKASFFVVGEKIADREEILKRIHKEGHSIGLHTYTHKYKKVYASEEAFIDEMDRTAEEVKRVLGIEARDIRFPGGSKKHLNDDMLAKLHEKNYRIFDWNASLSDGISHKYPPERLYKDAVKVVGRNPSRVVLLLHCDQPNTNTVKALPHIIDFYKEQGYTFQRIEESTPELYFRYKKKNLLWRVFYFQFD